MQIKADFTKEELMKEPDLLGYVSSPLDKIGLLSEMFCVMHLNPGSAESMFGRDKLYSIRAILDDAKSEIEYLIEIANEQWRQDREKWRANHAD